MNEHLKDPFFDYHAHLKVLPDHVLRDLARNDCAEWDYRKHAVEVLHVRKSPLVHHPDLHELRMELEAELDGLVFDHPDESAVVEPIPAGPGPLVASVTTATMFSDGPIPEKGVIESEEGIDPFILADEVTGAELNEIINEEPDSTTDSLPITPKRKYIKKPKEPVDA